MQVRRANGESGGETQYVKEDQCDVRDGNSNAGEGRGVGGWGGGKERERERKREASPI
jgi:hypothetical protein